MTDNSGNSLSDHTFVVPKKCILNHEDLKNWLDKGKSFTLFYNFIQNLGNSIIGVKISDNYPISDSVKKVCGLYEELSQFVDDIPPADTDVRYGNKSFKVWFQKMSEESPRMIRSILPDSLASAEIELSEYWKDSWGNNTRIDYGTGHEMFMASFYLCLNALGVFTEKDYPGIVLQCFNQYLKLVRKIQKTYRLEPAGSHGAWSLDDYQALPFYLGACQLQETDIKPSESDNEVLAALHEKEYIYFSGIKYIFDVKTGPFFEHSPILYSASQAQSWNKVTNGMLKVYKEEVLSKFPILQHFKFGSIITWLTD